MENQECKNSFVITLSVHESRFFNIVLRSIVLFNESSYMLIVQLMFVKLIHHHNPRTTASQTYNNSFRSKGLNW